ncbi:MAG: hypothetical protein IID17_14220 [Nitrospinae bacterium]|nr:hypothetical protein [Nitrospinota bacterium]
MKKLATYFVSTSLLFFVLGCQSDIEKFTTEYLEAMENAEAKISYDMVLPAERAAMPFDEYSRKLKKLRPLVLAAKERDSSLFAYTVKSTDPSDSDAPKYKVTVTQKIPQDVHMMDIMFGAHTYIQSQKLKQENAAHMKRAFKASLDKLEKELKGAGKTDWTQEKEFTITVVREKGKLYAFPGWQAEAAKKAATEKANKLAEEAKSLDFKGNLTEAMKKMTLAAAQDPNAFLVKGEIPRLKKRAAAMKKVTITHSKLTKEFIRKVKISLKNGSDFNFGSIYFKLDFLDKSGKMLGSKIRGIHAANGGWSPRNCCVAGYSGRYEMTVFFPDGAEKRTESLKIQVVNIKK